MHPFLRVLVKIASALSLFAMVFDFFYESLASFSLISLQFSQFQDYKVVAPALYSFAYTSQTSKN